MIDWGRKAPELLPLLSQESVSTALRTGDLSLLTFSPEWILKISLKQKGVLNNESATTLMKELRSRPAQLGKSHETTLVATWRCTNGD